MEIGAICASPSTIALLLAIAGNALMDMTHTRDATFPALPPPTALAMRQASEATQTRIAPARAATSGSARRARRVRSLLWALTAISASLRTMGTPNCKRICTNETDCSGRAKSVTGVEGACVCECLDNYFGASCETALTPQTFTPSLSGSVSSLTRHPQGTVTSLTLTTEQTDKATSTAESPQPAWTASTSLRSFLTRSIPPEEARPLATLRPIPSEKRGALVAADSSQQAVGVVAAVAALTCVGVGAGRVGVVNAMVRMSSACSGLEANDENSGGNHDEAVRGALSEDSGGIKDEKEEEPESLSILVHPLQFNMASDSGEDGLYFAAALSNGVIIPAVVALMAFGVAPRVSILYNTWRHGIRRGLTEARVSVGWPGVVAVPYVTLAEGLTTAIVRSFSANGALGAAMGCLGLVSLAGCVAVWLYALLFVVPRGGCRLVETKKATEGARRGREASAKQNSTFTCRCRMIENDNRKRPDITLAGEKAMKKGKQTKHIGIGSRVVSSLRQLLEPSSEWVPADPTKDGTLPRSTSSGSKQHDAADDNGISAPLLPPAPTSNTSGEDDKSNNNDSNISCTLAVPPLQQFEEGTRNPNGKIKKPNSPTVVASGSPTLTSFIRRILKPTDGPPSEATIEALGGALIGGKRLFYAEFASLFCSIIVGVMEGAAPTSSVQCQSQVIVALVATVAQCALGCLALVPAEIGLQAASAVLVTPMAIAATVLAFSGSDGVDSYSSLVDTVAMLQLGSNTLQLLSIFSSLLPLVLPPASGNEAGEGNKKMCMCTGMCDDNSNIFRDSISNGWAITDGLGEVGTPAASVALSQTNADGSSRVSIPSAGTAGTAGTAASAGTSAPPTWGRGEEEMATIDDDKGEEMIQLSSDASESSPFSSSSSDLSEFGEHAAPSQRIAPTNVGVGTSSLALTTNDYANPPREDEDGPDYSSPLGLLFAMAEARRQAAGRTDGAGKT